VGSGVPDYIPDCYEGCQTLIWDLFAIPWDHIWKTFYIVSITLYLRRQLFWNTLSMPRVHVKKSEELSSAGISSRNIPSDQERAGNFEIRAHNNF